MSQLIINNDGRTMSVMTRLSASFKGHQKECVMATLRVGAPVGTVAPHSTEYPPELIQLRPFEPYAISSAGRVLNIISGEGWLTFEGEDCVLREGDYWVVLGGQYPAVIASTGNHALVLEVR